MKIIVGGANSISRSIVRYLSHGNNDVIVIDNDEVALKNLAQEWDILPVNGLVSHPDILKQVDASSADLLIAATDSDEVNLVACQAAYTLFNIPRRIARLDSRVYLKAAWGGLFNDDSLPVDLVISPEFEIAKAIMNIIKNPGMSAVYPLVDKKLQLLSFRITRKCPLAQIPLKNIKDNLPEFDMMIVSIMRGGKVIIPSGEEMLHGGDEINLLIESGKIEDVVKNFGLEHKSNERVIIVGSNKTALYLAESLEQDDNIVSCKIIDEDPKTASFLAEKLNNTAVFCGSIMSENILSEIGISSVDASIAIDFEDKDNLVASMVAKKNGVENTIALVSERTANTQIINIGENILVDRTSIMMSSILKELRKVNMAQAYSFGSSLGEVWEIAIKDSSPLIGSIVSDIKLPQNSKICAIVRGDNIIYDVLKEHIAASDHIIFYCVPSAIKSAEKIFA
ncbi:MAG: Trk system potassium transporter TrkA [Alphaproteobacteria bacterium]|nr:Trk system potassium transporter TrkA [Alphaproteobacteria bacterium]